MVWSVGLELRAGIDRCGAGTATQSLVENYGTERTEGPNSAHGDTVGIDAGGIAEAL